MPRATGGGGQPHSDEAKKKISQAKAGKTRSPEEREAISDGQRRAWEKRKAEAEEKKQKGR